MHDRERVKWRKLKDKDLENSLRRWMACFDGQSPAERLGEVVKMGSGDTGRCRHQAIQAMED
jgi:hypothetical protein